MGSGKVFRFRWMGSWSRAFMMMNERQQKSHFSLSAMWRQRMQPSSCKQRAFITELNNIRQHHDLGFPRLQNLKKKEILCFKHLPCGILVSQLKYTNRKGVSNTLKKKWFFKEEIKDFVFVFWLRSTVTLKHIFIVFTTPSMVAMPHGLFRNPQLLGKSPLEVS